MTIVSRSQFGRPELHHRQHPMSPSPHCHFLQLAPLTAEAATMEGGLRSFKAHGPCTEAQDTYDALALLISGAIS